MLRDGAGAAGAGAPAAGGKPAPGAAAPPAAPAPAAPGNAPPGGAGIGAQAPITRPHRRATPRPYCCRRSFILDSLDQRTVEDVAEIGRKIGSPAKSAH